MVSHQLLLTVHPALHQAFSCYTFDEGQLHSGSWLRIDVSIECGTGAHMRAQALALVAVILYPVGLPLLFSWLLYLAREDITSGHHFKPLPKAIGFLFREYRSQFFLWGAFSSAIR